MGAKGKKGGRVTAPKPARCERRSAHYGRPLSHRFTSHLVVRSLEGAVVEDVDICSWCGRRKV